MPFLFIAVDNSEASTICPTWMLSWLSLTILNLPLPICWISARNTLVESWIIHHVQASPVRCSFLPNKLFSAKTPIILDFYIMTIFGIRILWIDVMSLYFLDTVCMVFHIMIEVLVLLLFSKRTVAIYQVYISLLYLCESIYRTTISAGSVEPGTLSVLLKDSPG